MSDFEYRTNSTIASLVARLTAARSVMILSHEKPDGDAIGSCAMVARALDALGITSETWLLGAVADSLRSLIPDLSVRSIPGDLPGEEHDLIVLVDTGAWSQLAPMADFLREHRERIIGIDHHARGDDVAGERVVDTTCGSCTQVLVPLIDAMGVSLTHGADEDGRYSIAEAAMVGLGTDTGWFRYDNCGAEGLKLAARLVEAGANKNRLTRVIEDNDRPQRIMMAGRAMSSARFADDDRSVVMSLSLEDFKTTGAVAEELAGLVNHPMSIGSIEVSVLITQTEASRVKMSFRSKPPKMKGSTRFVDVNELAACFGGGGHVHAAGARLDESLEDARTQVSAAITEALQTAGFSE
jgi:phosphoesterase RecJ-like protein